MGLGLGLGLGLGVGVRVRVRVTLHSTEPGVRAQLLSHQSAETELPILRLQTCQVGLGVGLG